MDRTRQLLLAASSACGPNSAQLGRWLRHAGDSAALDEAASMDAAGIDSDKRQRFCQALARPDQRLLALLENSGCQLLSILDQDYPPLLRTLSDAPGLLYVRGDTALLNQPQIAVVGARTASREGMDTARHFSRLLAGNGFVVSSGLARGIDRSAHLGAMETGRTLAVLGHGPDRIYPQAHQRLAQEIIAGGGALVSEFPPGLGPRREHFPLRNRIISGLSLAVLVIEAATHSGSLITARLAAQQGREVFAVPGSIHNPLSKGCHRLLRDGANWLEDVDDLRQAFPAMEQTAALLATPDPPALLQHFVSGTNSADALAVRSGLASATLAQQLFELEIQGLIERVPGGYCRRFPPA